MSTTSVPHPTAEDTIGRVVHPRKITIISHSPIFYWWPVWSLGYLFAILTWFQGVRTQFGDVEVVIHPSKSLGVVYTIVFLLVILMTHIAVRGVASMTVIVSLIALTLLFLYFDWWETIMAALGKLAIYMNLGFYVFFSSSVLFVWALAFFVFDRLDYWVMHPGQLIHHRVFGGGEESYDTRGMSLSKLRSDLFRHWILGLGSGDLHIAATGAKSGEFVVPNVLFIGTKLAQLQDLVATKPDERSDNIVTAGTPD